MYIHTSAPLAFMTETWLFGLLAHVTGFLQSALPVKAVESGESTTTRKSRREDL